MKQTRHFLYLVGLCLLGFSLPLNAQITVTNATFPALSDTLRFVFDLNPVGNPNIFITPPGGNQNWDFSTLAVDFTQQQVFVSPATGTGSASFPSANLLYVQGGIEYYLNVTSQTVQLLGTYVWS
ncbi:MAG TPA: hypothetical protein PKD70_08285 [Saprospiraceae bacterium]|nr:hypothetical protein [Saprospiraceae bacterium]